MHTFLKSDINGQRMGKCFIILFYLLEMIMYFEKYVEFYLFCAIFKT